MNDVYPICPKCNMSRDPEDRFCGWCGEDMMKHDSVCYECGAPKDKGDAVEFKKVFKQIMCGIR